MRKLLLGSSMLIGAGSLATAAHASDGVKLEVGGFFNQVFEGVFDSKQNGHFGGHRNYDALQHNAEVYFKGETTLDNGLTVGARIELEGETAADQIDKSFVYWSGGFGKVQVGTQNDALENYCVLPPGNTPNFSAYSPTLGWGSNDPLHSNQACKSADNDSNKITYTTPNFGGFQLAVSYTPSLNAETYIQQGVNNSGTPSNTAGTAHQVFDVYAMYTFKGDGWGAQWGGGGSWQAAFNDGTGGNNHLGGKASAYQTDLNLTFGAFALGGVFEYRDIGGEENNAWVAGAGAAYTMDAWKFGVQYSHGFYDSFFSTRTFGENGYQRLDHVTANVGYTVGPGVIVDGSLGYTWYRDTHNAKPNATNAYQAFSVGIGTALTF